VASLVQIYSLVHFSAPVLTLWNERNALVLEYFGDICVAADTEAISPTILVSHLDVELVDDGENTRLVKPR